MKKRFLRLFSFFLVLVVLFSCLSAPAFAVDFNSARANRFKALIASAIQAINISLSASQASFSDLTNFLADPAGLVYTYSEEASDEYWDQQTIHMYRDYTTIDGVPYTDIWLSHDIADKMRVDAFDFQTAYNIASNSNGTFASGAGFFENLPVYFQNNHNYTQKFRFDDYGSYSVGNFTVAITDEYSQSSTLRAFLHIYKNGVLAASEARRDFPVYIQFRSSGSSIASDYQVCTKENAVYANDWSSLKSAAGPYDVDATPFDFDYVSGVIPASETLPQDKGLMLRVPSSAVDQWMDDNPDQTNVDWDIDIDSPDIKAKLDDLFDLIVPIIPVIEADFSEQHVAPVPPVPGDTISNTDYSILDQTLQDIREDIQAIPSAIQEFISSIPAKLDSIIQAIGNLGDTILQEIEEGPIRLARKAIDAIKSIFLPILVSLKNALGIWHYVVEWFNAISGPFTWFRGVMASSSPSLLVPIYAAIAGFIVISVYRRFGR